MFGDKTLNKRQALETAVSTGGLLVSAISCWEVGMLVARGKLILGLPCLEWVEKALATPGVSLLEISPSIAIEASYLPVGFHNDPADRILVASARVQNLTLATRDAKILEYSRSGHVRTLAC
jgi:PIN domain nuclease of toxin-antitoxin system